jgi:hypothetical protein
MEVTHTDQVSSELSESIIPNKNCNRKMLNNLATKNAMKFAIDIWGVAKVFALFFGRIVSFEGENLR